MSVSKLPPRNADDPRMLLMSLAGDSNIEDVLVIVRMRDDRSATYATNRDPAFLSVAAILSQDLALKAVKGEILLG